MIEHENPPARMLIVPSAGVRVHLGGEKADVVFLSIGDAEKLSNEHIRQYWQEAVEKTDAQLVIPIHWDNFFRAVDTEGARLKPYTTVVDDVACTMDTITYLNAGRVKRLHAAIRACRVRQCGPCDRLAQRPASSAECGMQSTR